VPVVPEPIPVGQLARPPAPPRKYVRSRKAPALKTVVILRRSAGVDKTAIAAELGIARNTVTAILNESDAERQMEHHRIRANTIVPLAFDAVETQLKDKQDGNLGIRYLEDMGVIGANAAQHRAPDAGIVNAIQMLIQPGASVLVGGTVASSNELVSDAPLALVGTPAPVAPAPDAQGEAAENPPTTSARAGVRP